MGVKVSIPRIRNVRLKNGCTVHLLDAAIADRIAEADEDLWNEFTDLAGEVYSNLTDIGGFAFVMWDRSGKSGCNMRAYSPNVPISLVPHMMQSMLQYQLTRRAVCEND